MTDNVLRVGPVELEAFSDYVIVIRDEFRSGYECTVCSGEGELRCPNCAGTGRSIIVKDGKCSMCDGLGTVLCPECKGKTVVEGGIVIPEDRQNEPTTGTIRSCGPDVTLLSSGQSVLFPNYAGHQMKLGGDTPDGREVEMDIVVMHEKEVICKVKGHLELRRLKKKVAASTTA